MIRRTPIRRVSKKRAAENRQYSAARKLFLEQHPFCQITIQEMGVDEQDVIWKGGRLMVDGKMAYFPRSVEIHHKNKRRGKMLLDTTYWMAVSREAHLWVEQHKNLAREKGYLLNF